MKHALQLSGWLCNGAMAKFNLCQGVEFDQPGTPPTIPPPHVRLLACLVIKHGVQATAGCPALQSSNIGSLPAPSSPAKGLLPATSDTQPDAEGMPVAATDVDVPPTQQPLLHTEAVATDQLAGGQWHSRSDELPTLDLDTTPAASEATAPVLQSHLNRVTATATSLRAASKDQLSTSQPGVRQSSGEGQPAASQPYSIQANSLLPTCSDAATSALAPALHPQASFNHSTGLSSLGEQQVLVLDQPTAGCTSIEVATHVQCATHFTLPPNTGAAAAKRRIFAHGGRDAVPRYGHITQNVYTRGLVKPQRLHQDEVPVCTCHRSAASDGFVVPASLRRSGRHRARRQVQHWGCHSPTTVVTPATPAAAAPCSSLDASAKGCKAMVQTCLQSPSTSAMVRSVSEDGTACGASCFNRQLFMCCDPKTCPFGGNCTNK